MNTSSTTTIRLNKYIAHQGLASRRQADDYIASGLVQVKGKRVFELGRKIDPSQDIIKVKGREVKIDPEKVYFSFHKPAQVLCSQSDPEGRPLISDYFKK